MRLPSRAGRIRIAVGDFVKGSPLTQERRRSPSILAAKLRHCKSVVGVQPARSPITNQFFVKGRGGWTDYTWTTRPRRGKRKQAAVTMTVDVLLSDRMGVTGRARSLEVAADSSPGRQPWEPSLQLARDAVAATNTVLPDQLCHVPLLPPNARRSGACDWKASAFPGTIAANLCGRSTWLSPTA